MNEVTITSELFHTVMRKMPKWKALGPDGVYGYWLKYLPSVHPKLLHYFNEFITTGGISLLENPSLLHVTLIMKCKAKGVFPSNYRPTTCLSATWKLFSRLKYCE